MAANNRLSYVSILHKVPLLVKTHSSPTIRICVAVATRIILLVFAGTIQWCSDNIATVSKKNRYSAEISWFSALPCVNPVMKL
jgi:hypothetical protein